MLLVREKKKTEVPVNAFPDVAEWHILVSNQGHEEARPIVICATGGEPKLSSSEPFCKLAPHETAFEPGAVLALKGVSGRFRSKTAASFPRRARVVGILTLTAMVWCGLGKPAPRPQLVNQNEAELAPYRNVKSYVDRTPAELMTMIPDLKGLEPVANKEEGEKDLAAVLGRLGENVRQSYEKFPDTTSREDVTMERLRPDGKVDSMRRETFRYLVVSRSEQGASTLDEYRTDMTGELVEPAGLEQGLVVTKGFVSVGLYFHPSVRSDAFFAYLGKQKLGGKATDVVAFAQRPGWAKLIGHLAVAGRPGAVLLVQGLAWIDSTSYQIVRLRTDLLAPRPDIGLTGETAEITFGEVRFPEMPESVLWLPQEVTVTMAWEGKVEITKTISKTNTGPAVISSKWEHRTYRNIHCYSDYKLFASKTRIRY